MTATPTPGGRPAENAGTPLGLGASDEPANTLPAEPVNVTRIDAAVDQGRAASAADAGQRQGGPTEKRQDNEEPEPTLEEDLPSDGRDEKGEAMIRDLPPQVGTPSPAGKPSPQEP